MKNVLIAGSSGMVGSLALRRCLDHPEVGTVTTLVRRPSGIDHPKLHEVVHTDYLDYSSIHDGFNDQDVCLYCIGVYTGQVPEDEFRTITVDVTVAFAEALRARSDKVSFCFLSGAGADQTEQSRMMFARDKGAAENALQALGFDGLYLFRPGYIYPVRPRTEPNLSYRIMRLLYKPILSRIYPNIGIASDALAETMVHVGLYGSGQTILENKDIRSLHKTLRNRTSARP